MSFRIALRARRAYSSLCSPQEIVDHSFGTMIAERRREGQDLLYLSEAGPNAPQALRAPSDLRPSHVMIATRVSRDPGAGSETYLLNRYIHASACFAGLFLPADGYLTVTGTGSDISIAGVARLASATQSDACCAGLTIARARPEVPGAVGCVLHIDARRIPWVHERVAKAFDPEPAEETSDEPLRLV